MIGGSSSDSSILIVEKGLEGGCLGLWGLCTGARGRGVRRFLEVDAVGPPDRADWASCLGVLPPWDLLCE